MDNETIKNAKPGEVIWDRDSKRSVPGLHVRVRDSGAKAFYLFYRSRSGQQRRPKLGDVGNLTVTEAREMAEKIMHDVKLGRDLMGVVETRKSEMTVKDLFTLAWQKHWDQERYKTSGWAKECKRIYETLIAPAFANEVLSDMTAVKIREWHAGFRETRPYAGNRALEVLSRMFTVAEEQERRPQNMNPCALVSAHPETKRARYATKVEIAQIGPILEREAKNHPAAVAFIYLLMLTGSRPRAIERATWEQLKPFEGGDGKLYGLLTFDGKTTAKTGKKENVIVPPQAMKIIAKLPRNQGQTICGIKMPRRLWRRIRDEIGAKDLWARDWRRTFATVGLSSGVALDTIGELLNHETSQTTKIYGKLMDQEAVEATGLIANRMESLLKGAK